MRFFKKYLQRDAFRVPSFRIWIVFFIYTLTIALIIHAFLLWNPLHLKWSVDNGLISPDSKMYHRMAVALSQKISLHGWDAWELRPGAPPGQSMAALAAILYTVFFASPVVFLPLNAILHATSGVVLLHIVHHFLRNWHLSLFCTLPFMLFPSSALWYAQILKEGFSILGFLIILSFWLFWAGKCKERLNYFTIFYRCIFFFAGVGLVWIVRAYLLNIFQILSVPIAIFVTIKMIMYCNRHNWLYRLVCIASIWTVLGSVAIYKNLNNTPDVVNVINTNRLRSFAAKPKQSYYENKSHEMRFLYEKTRDKIFFKIGVLLDRRMGFLTDNERHNSNSRIDTNVSITTVSELISYLPRAAQIVFLSPFPDQWFSAGSLPENSIMRRLAGVEMLIVYFALAFLPIAVIFWWKDSNLWISLFFAGGLMMLHGIVITNVGSLYRMRYGYLMIFVSLGLAGGLELVRRLGKCASVTIDSVPN